MRRNFISPVQVTQGLQTVVMGAMFPKLLLYIIRLYGLADAMASIFPLVNLLEGPPYLTHKLPMGSQDL